MKLRTVIAALGLLALAAGAAGADSLWTATGEEPAHWFGDTKARRVGDTVTILIKEESNAKTDVSESHSKDTATKAVIEELRCALLGVNKPKVGAAEDEKGLPKLEWSSSRKSDAKATAESKEMLQLRISAVVKEVLPNGNLLIDASREIRHDEDRRLVHLTGIVRPTDISAANTVLSEYIAEARISYEGVGPAARTKNRGWAARILDIFWPF